MLFNSHKSDGLYVITARSWFLKCRQ